METPQSDIQDLISKYLSGNASHEEASELEGWVLANPENRKTFMDFKKAWMLVGVEQEKEKIDVAGIWEATKQGLFEEAKVVEMKPQTKAWRWWLAAAVVATLIASFLLWPRLGSDGQAQSYVAEGASNSILLEDGSKVTLNQSSKLEFLAENEGAQRLAKLEGDAFFEVARDEKHPFIIETQGLDIEVLGTSFYVDARESQEEIQVSDTSGRVAVRSSEEDEVVLQAEQKAIFDKANQQLSKVEESDLNARSIVTDTLIFKQTPLEEVVFVLNRHFGVNIVLQSEKLQSCELTARYENKSLDIILAALEANFNLSIEKEGKNIVYARSCNH